MNGKIKEYDDKKGKWQSYEFTYILDVDGDVPIELTTYGKDRSEAMSNMTDCLKAILKSINSDIKELELQIME